MNAAAFVRMRVNKARACNHICIRLRLLGRLSEAELAAHWRRVHMLQARAAQA